MQDNGNTSRLPKMLDQVVEVLGDLQPNVHVRRVTRRTCRHCDGLPPFHRRDCLDHGEGRFEDEAERAEMYRNETFKGGE